MDFGIKCIIGMVGLPNRGKTYFSRKLARYLCWIGLDAQVFNVTEYRAELMTKNANPDGTTEEFFDYSKFNTEAAQEAMQDVAEYINDNGEIAIYDGLNITHMEREQFETELEKIIHCPYNLVWVESWCDDKDVLISNFKTTRENYAEYKGMTDDEVYETFESKIQNLKDQYETLDSSVEKSFIKIVNMGKSVEIVKVNGIKLISIVKFLLCLKPYKRPIFFSRHGESVYNTLDLIGGDSLLSEKGLKYGECLKKFFNDQKEYYNQLNLDQAEYFNLEEMNKFCSTLRRTQQTIGFLEGIGKGDPIIKKELDEIDAGSCDSMTYEEINKRFPIEYEMRLEDKLNYRYPRGESYVDLIRRLEPFIFEVESSSKPLFIVSHQATLRCLYSYFEAQKVDTIPYINVPLHTLIKLEPGILGFTETIYKFDLDTKEYKTEVINVNYQNDLPKKLRFKTVETDIKNGEIHYEKDH